MAMKVKWHPRWKNCSVVMIIKNDPIIQQLKEKWGTDEVSSNKLTFVL